MQVFTQEPPAQGKHFASGTSCAYIHHLAQLWHLVKYCVTIYFNKAFCKGNIGLCSYAPTPLTFEHHKILMMAVTELDVIIIFSEHLNDITLFKHVMAVWPFR